MVSRRWCVGTAWRAAVVVAAFVAGWLGVRMVGYWGAYHERPDGVVVSRAVVAGVPERSGERAAVRVRLSAGPREGEEVLAAFEPPEPRLGGRCLVALPKEGTDADARVLCPERDAFLAGLAAALVALLVLSGGRGGLATAASVAWALVLLLGVLLPAARRGVAAAPWCVPLALAIAIPTLLAIGGLNRKSLGAIAGTLCGVVAGGLLSLGFVHAMALTGLEVEYGAVHHLENRLWFAPGLERVDFASLLVGGMLLAGLGAVMDVSMAVAATIAEVHRARPQARLRDLLRSGLAAGRDIIGVMVLTLGMVYIGSHLVSFVSLRSTGWARHWLRLANYEELAAEFVRMAAAAVGMALCVPAAALASALLHCRSRAGQAEEAAGPASSAPPRRPLRRAALPVAVGLLCLVLAGLADERTLRTYIPAPDQPQGETVARLVDFDEPVLESSAHSTHPHDMTYMRSRLLVVQPWLGPHAGELLAVRSLVGPNPAGNLPVRRGAAVRLDVEDTPTGPDAKVFKLPLRYRWGLVALLVTAITLLAAGGRVGLRVLLVVATAVVLMMGGLVTLLAEGWPPLPLAGAFCLVMLLGVFAISGAVDRKAFAAIVGTAAGLAVAAALLAGSSAWLGFTGSESIAARFLAALADRTGTAYDYTGLLVATLLVALFGLAMDTAVTVATGVAQVCGARPDVSRTEATAAGLSIARDVVGTMVLTLVFAFAGLRLYAFLMPIALSASAAELVNGEAGASEILYVLVGAIALVATGPATALVAPLLMTGSHAPRPASGGAHRAWRLWAAGAVVLVALAGGVLWAQMRHERLARAKLPPLPADRTALAEAARTALGEGKTGEALRALWILRRRFPDDPQPRAALAHACIQRRWIAQAQRDIQAALDLGADDAQTHYVAGVACAWSDQLDEAERHLRRAIELDPQHAAARDALRQLFGP